MKVKKSVMVKGLWYMLNLTGIILHCETDKFPNLFKEGPNCAYQQRATA